MIWFFIIMWALCLLTQYRGKWYGIHLIFSIPSLSYEELLAFFCTWNRGTEVQTAYQLVMVGLALGPYAFWLQDTCNSTSLRAWTRVLIWWNKHLGRAYGFYTPGLRMKHLKPGGFLWLSSAPRVLMDVPLIKEEYSTTPFKIYLSLYLLLR